MKNVVITGVSKGIGRSTTEELIHRGYQVFGSVRKREEAERLQEELGLQFTPLIFDVRDSTAISTAVAEVKESVGKEGLHALINNAGIAIPGPLMYTPLADFRAQFEVNLFGLLDLTQQFLPLLGAAKDAQHPPGRIINISSISGKIAYPFMGGYAASKHALEALSDSLRRELMIYGIDVILIEPGTTNTPIKDKYKEQIAQYAATDYSEMVAGLEQQFAERERTGLPVEKVVKAICKAIETEEPKTRYAIPRKFLTGWLIPRWLPDRWLDRFVANRLGLKR